LVQEFARVRRSSQEFAEVRRSSREVTVVRGIGSQLRSFNVSPIVPKSVGIHKYLRLSRTLIGPGVHRSLQEFLGVSMARFECGHWL
jgi:hypothetical protein